MPRLLHEIKDDLTFIRSHALQPRWYKVLKIVIIAGFLAGYFFLFGWTRTAVFFAAFMVLSLLVHLVYRIKTDKWRRSWLDFVVAQTGNGPKPESIGKFYYSAVAINAMLSIIISQLIPGR